MLCFQTTCLLWKLPWYPGSPFPPFLLFKGILFALQCLEVKAKETYGTYFQRRQYALICETVRRCFINVFQKRKVFQLLRTFSYLNIDLKTSTSKSRSWERNFTVNRKAAFFSPEVLAIQTIVFFKQQQQGRQRVAVFHYTTEPHWLLWKVSSTGRVCIALVFFHLKGMRGHINLITHYILRPF